MELDAAQQPTIPILFKHATPLATPCPPGLPKPIRARVLLKAGRKLLEALEDFAKKDSIGSHASQMSEPLSKSWVLVPEDDTTEPDWRRARLTMCPIKRKGMNGSIEVVHGPIVFAAALWDVPP